MEVLMVITSHDQLGNTGRKREPFARLPDGDAADLELLPFASVATSRPPCPGSKRRWPSPRGVSANKGFGRHHSPISSVKASNARKGVALTRIETMTAAVIFASSRHAP